MNISDGCDLIVRQANDLIESLYKLPTISEERIIRLLISQIKPNDEDFKTYRIRVEDFAEIFGIKETSGRLYEQVDKATEALTKRSLNIRMGKSYLHVNWLSSALYVHGSGYVDLRFDPYLKPFLLHLNGYYTKYKIIQIAHFQSRYSIRIYELLKMETFKTPAGGIFKKLFDYIELRSMLGIEETEYSRVADFKKNVIDIAIKEINTRSDLFIIKIVPVKSGKKISYWEFHFQNSRQQKLEIDPAPPQLQEVKEHPEDVTELIAFGIAEETAYKWRKKYGVARILRNIGYVKGKKNAGKVKDDLTGYVASAISNDYAQGLDKKIKETQDKKIETQLLEDKRKSEEEEEEIKQKNESIETFGKFMAFSEEKQNEIRKSFYLTLNTVEGPKWDELERKRESNIEKKPLFKGKFKKFLIESVFN